MQHPVSFTAGACRYLADCWRKGQDTSLAKVLGVFQVCCRSTCLLVLVASCWNCFRVTFPDEKSSAIRVGSRVHLCWGHAASH